MTVKEQIVDESDRKMKNSFKWVLPVVLLIVSFSCNKSSTPTTSDTTKPVINLIDPTPGKQVVLGAALHLQMGLSDNVELKSYKITIAKSLKGAQTSDWAFSQTWTIAAGNKSYMVNHNEIMIPLTVAGNQTTTGNYDFTVYCTDLAGNEASATLMVVLAK